jgi:STE24 endopeptidase
MNASLNLTWTLVFALLAHVALKFWLNARQVRHIARHRSAVPLAYADTISLVDHQKAADYTLAKARLSQIDIALDAAVLLCWTLLGGLDALNQVLLAWMGPGMAQQMAGAGIQLGGWVDRLAFVAHANLWRRAKVWFQQNHPRIVVG